MTYVFEEARTGRVFSGKDWGCKYEINEAGTSVNPDSNSTYPLCSIFDGLLLVCNVIVHKLHKRFQIQTNIEYSRFRPPEITQSILKRGSTGAWGKVGVKPFPSELIKWCNCLSTHRIGVLKGGIKSKHYEYASSTFLATQKPLLELFQGSDFCSQTSRSKNNLLTSSTCTCAMHPLERKLRHGTDMTDVVPMTWPRWCPWHHRRNRKHEEWGHCMSGVVAYHDLVAVTRIYGIIMYKFEKWR